MQLTKQEQEVKEVGQAAKGFLDSNLFQALQHHLSGQLDKEFPKPNHKGWEAEYQYAKAYEVAASDIVRFFVSLKSQFDQLVEKEKQKETSIEEA